MFSTRKTMRIFIHYKLYCTLRSAFRCVFLIFMTKKTNIQPLFDNVLIKPLEAQQKTESGIYLPDSAKEKPQKGEVMAIGPGAASDDGKVNKMVVKVGDKVLYK